MAVSDIEGWVLLMIKWPIGDRFFTYAMPVWYADIDRLQSNAPLNTVSFFLPWPQLRKNDNTLHL